jgi:hypothetical protein
MTNRFSLPPDSIAVPAPLPDNLGAVRFANRATELTIPLLAAIAVDRALVYVDDGRPESAPTAPSMWTRTTPTTG